MAEHNLTAVEIIKGALAQDLLSGRITLVLGWVKGHYWWQSRPFFAENEQDLRHLAWDSFCAVNLSRYLPEELNRYQKVGLLLKGCDARALNRLVQDKAVPRERVVAYGLPCPGMLNFDRLVEAFGGYPSGIIEEDGQVQILGEGVRIAVSREEMLQEKCRGCFSPNPVTCDQLLLPPVTGIANPGRFRAVEQLERLSFDMRYSYWSDQMERCLRCYACRRICPCCSCRSCFVEREQPRWLSKSFNKSEKFLFHLIRAYHGAGRCIDCGECARACPVGISLQELNRKLIKDLNELYGPYEAGLDPDQTLPLLTYKAGDPAAFSEK